MSVPLGQCVVLGPCALPRTGDPCAQRAGHTRTPLTDCARSQDSRLAPGRGGGRWSKPQDAATSAARHNHRRGLSPRGGGLADPWTTLHMYLPGLVINWKIHQGSQTDMLSTITIALQKRAFIQSVDYLALLYRSTISTLC